MTKSAWSVKAIAGNPISIARSQLRSMEPLGPSYDHSVWTWRSACTALDSALLAPKGPFTAAHSARLAPNVRYPALSSFCSSSLASFGFA